MRWFMDAILIRRFQSLTSSHCRAVAQTHFFQGHRIATSIAIINASPPQSIKLIMDVNVVTCIIEKNG
jgi:hypothetical protein